MAVAYPLQKFQDWFTQQWVIIRGKKIEPKDFPWLIGPFGTINAFGEDLICQLAEKEQLTIQRNASSQGILESIGLFNFAETDLEKLSKKVIDFYENTSEYNLSLTVKWNPFFKFFGLLLNSFFSDRINQLNVPLKANQNIKPLKSEIVTLSDSKTHKIKYTIWLRTSENKIMYSGIYGTCKLPSGKSCIKVIFPLPQGNATVIMIPKIGKDGALILESSGKKIGDPGFYFLLKDAKNVHWTKFIASFRDRLIINEEKDIIYAEQTLTLWKQTVLKFNYTIQRKNSTN
ncbi:hypothetical protein SAMN02927937_01058 [Paenimyroides aquimaris]|uniref:Uncharacterized protein n=1 Tax=Paenimyroides marinum TaxID=1159016 RepID=A0A1H6KA50_9FLAO|nr:hypothetical protein [Paenimyroides aquimaris]SEH72335.1 hypothetical protein SAMN02927937_01058 [Paenimyroides aquimaris]